MSFWHLSHMSLCEGTLQVCTPVLSHIAAKSLSSAPRARFVLLLETSCVVAVTIASARDEVGEERFTLYHVFPLLLYGMLNVILVVCDRPGIREHGSLSYNLHKLPATRLYLLKFPQLLKRCHQLGTSVQKYSGQYQNLPTAVVHLTLLPESQRLSRGQNKLVVHLTLLPESQRLSRVWEDQNK